MKNFHRSPRVPVVLPTLVPTSARQSAGHPEEGRKDLLSMTQQMQIKDPAAKGSTPYRDQGGHRVLLPRHQKVPRQGGLLTEAAGQEDRGEHPRPPTSRCSPRCSRRTGAFTTSSATRPSAYTGASSTSTGSRAATRRCSATRRS